MTALPRTLSTGPNVGDSPEAEAEPVQRGPGALRDLLLALAERATAEAEVEKTRAAQDAAADQEYARSRQTLDERLEETRQSDARADEARRRAVVDAAIAGEAEAKSEFARASRRIASEFDGIRDAAKNDHRRGTADAASHFESGQKRAASAFAEARKPLDDAARLRDAFQARLASMYAEYKGYGLAEPPSKPSRESYEKFEDPVDEIYKRLTRVEKPLKLLEGLIIPKAVKGARFAWVIAGLVLLLAYPLAVSLGVETGLPAALIGGLAVGLGLRYWLVQVSRAQVSKLYFPIAQALIDAEALANHRLGVAEAALKAERARLATKRDEDLQNARQKQAKTVSTGEALRDERLRQINEKYAQKVVDIQTRQQVEMRDAINLYEQRRGEVEAMGATSRERLDARYREAKARVRSAHEASWAAMETRWRGAITRVVGDVGGWNRAVDAIGPAWDDPSWADRALPTSVPPVVRFGEVRLDLGSLPGGLPTDPRLRDGVPETLSFPALLPFPDRANLVIEAPAAGRPAAIAMLQAAMFRLLTSLPPGQVRFTIIDPIGIGRNFGAFMHLADYDEALVGGQVCTEARQIEERLAELSAHMEKVTQKYLRNEYASIGEYNAVAGEVAEPYRVLVVADFPTNFEEKTAARLAAIASGGIPCGVLTLVAVDLDRPVPSGFVLDDLRASATTLAWKSGRLAWDDPDFGPYVLTPDAPPPSDMATRLIQRAGAAARGAKRVEVPFEFIAPAEGEYWTRDSRLGIDLPLGKAGAMKRQNLTLGQGTSQHVLVAGRTGSGKSTLLHALITNLALNYGPDEVDLYLIDFKKGVEFKVYATQRLPHASVVAIESEREFGISVLQRLDAEMRSRADRFRDAGVQDVNGYRNSPGAPPLPRCLLIIDEFQEFFVEDDKVGQEAALLLDRLVRQGRAFGVHVHLGSQTLGGAYALARSTLGQMAVRIALQCSEADASLILSESNPAATLLSRPGEAVYNDANGLPEGNHFFQVVWLSDERREAYLKRIRELAEARPPALKRSMIVFEGDTPADLARNAPLARRLDADAWGPSPRSAQAWVGDPVAIKDPTSGLFRRQGANHLLVVGQDAEQALGVVASSLLSLAAQFPPGSGETRSGARFHVVDGTPEDSPRADYLVNLAKGLPQTAEAVGWRDAGRVVVDLAAEVKRRQEPDGPDGPELFLVLHDLPRFRELRRRDDDFSFSRRDDDVVSPADALSTLLGEGPGYGVHVIAWCDNLNNLNRVFSHQALREFGMRVLFQMSPNDSGHLLDAPHASRLGPHRALFSSEEENRLEKFRPYAPPDEEWAAKLSARLRDRGTPADSPG